MTQKLYLIGSLRNKRIPLLADKLRKEMPDVEVFDDWHSAGPMADDHWKEYEQERNRTYQQALNGYAASHVFGFDRYHLDTSSHVVLVLPAGKSGHMEVMYAEYATRANTAILLDPDDVRWDVMYQFIPTILNNDEEIMPWLSSTSGSSEPRKSVTPMASKPGSPEASLTPESPRSSKEFFVTSPELSRQWLASPSLELGSTAGRGGRQCQTASVVMKKQK